MALLEIYNDQQQLQFTEDQYPFNLKSVVTVNPANLDPVTLGGNTGSSRPVVYRQGTVNIGTSQAIIATRGPEFHSAGALDSNGNLTIMATNGGNPITVYVFGKGPAVNNANSGFTVYGPDGQISFTADDKPLKPIDTAVYAEMDNPYGVSVISGSGKLVAMVHNSQAQASFGEYSDENTGYRNLKLGWGLTSNDNITMTYVTRVRLRLGAQQDDYYVSSRGVVTAVDVTNYI